MKTKAKYIAVDGGEGSGKSSQIALLKREFGDALMLTREPGGSPDGAVIRRILLDHPLSPSAEPETELHLMFVDRYDHVTKVIKPALEQGIHVITDRSDASSYAYQVVAGTMQPDDAQFEPGKILLREKMEMKFWEYRRLLPILPDLYITFDVKPKIGLTRRKSTNDTNHIDRRPVRFHDQVRRGLLDFPKFVPQRSVVIDANRPLEQVTEDFFAVIRKELNGFS